MIRTSVDTGEQLDRALAILRNRGERITTARRMVLEVLASTTDHLSAERICDQVQADAPDVHRATVYRTLDALVQAGVVAHVHLPHGPVAYHFRDVREGRQHVHLACRVCGNVIDTAPELLDGVAAAVLSEHGFGLDPDHVALTGWCATCRHEMSDPVRSGPVP